MQMLTPCRASCQTRARAASPGSVVLRHAAVSEQLRWVLLAGNDDPLVSITHSNIDVSVHKAPIILCRKSVDGWNEDNDSDRVKVICNKDAALAGSLTGLLFASAFSSLKIAAASPTDKIGSQCLTRNLYSQDVLIHARDGAH